MRFPKKFMVLWVLLFVAAVFCTIDFFTGAPAGAPVNSPALSLPAGPATVISEPPATRQYDEYEKRALGEDPTDFLVNP